MVGAGEVSVVESGVLSCAAIQVGGATAIRQVTARNDVKCRMFPLWG